MYILNKHIYNYNEGLEIMEVFEEIWRQELQEKL